MTAKMRPIFPPSVTVELKNVTETGDGVPAMRARNNVSRLSEYRTRSLETEVPTKTHRRCHRGLPARYGVVILGFLGFFNIYAMRVNLSVAMVAMVNTSTNLGNQSTVTAECPSLVENSDVPVYNEMKGEKYNWDSETQGQMLAAFFYGYVLTQVPAGTLAEKFGAKWLFGIGVAVTAVFSLLTPLAAELGKEAFIAVRVIEGLGEGVTFPAMNALLSKWSPKYERSIVTTIVYTGTQIGNVIAMPISGILCGSEVFGGWPSVFYFFGALGCLWFVFWIFFVYENPSQHPNISKEELTLIQEDNDQSYDKSPPVPWKSILTSMPVWAVAVAHFGHNWGFLILLTELPTYLSNMLHFSIQTNGFYSALPYLLQALTAWIVGYIADGIRKRGHYTINTVRKTANTIGLIGPAICLLLITIAGCRPTLIMALLCLAMAINGFVYSGFNVAPIDMSPDFAGTLMGITNAIANLCGFIGPAVVGYFTKSGQTAENWNYVFYSAAGVYVLTALFYLVFGTAELQPWGIAKANEIIPANINDNKPRKN